MSNNHIAAIASPKRARRRLVLRDSLGASDVGNTLFLKLCGFILDQQARLLEVSEHNYCLKIGHTRWERFWHGRGSHDPVVVTLAVRRDERPDRNRKAHASQTIVDVDVRPAGWGWNAAAFESCAAQIVQRLRRHLMVG
jgi:hypothetical protein